MIYGLLGAIFGLIGYGLYIKSILAGKTKPQRVSWTIGASLVAIAFINQIANGGGSSAWFLGASAISSVVIVLLAYWKGAGGSTKLDRVVMLATGLLFTYWVFSHDTHNSVIISVIIDLISLLPTIRGAYVKPRNESYSVWFWSGLAGLMSFLALPHWDLYLILFPAFIITGNTIVMSAKYLGSRN